jgi:RNA polymerase sigma-70 factor (ECF subfamily)
MIQTETTAQSYAGQLSDLTQHEFGLLVEAYRQELQVHCYRMLGGVQDAEDLVQETLLRAWRRRATFAGRAPVRAWLYKIATNLCLDALEQRNQRTLPVVRQAAANANEAIPAAVNEPIWLEPFPDDLMAPVENSPEVRVLAREHLSLAFLVALQQLPARQRAVLLLRDVLDWSAAEVADLLDMSVSAVKSALYRARVTLAEGRGETANLTLSRGLDEEALRAQLERYVQAWERADINTFVALLQADATFSMPPIPSWYQGVEQIRALVSKTVFAGQAAGRWRLQATRANGTPAFGLYRQDSEGRYQAYGIQVVHFAGTMIADVTTFRTPNLLTYFKLPLVL